MPTARIIGTGGDQIYNFAPVMVSAGGTFDFNGNSETFATLNGAGLVDNTAAGTTATITLTNGTCTFSGTLQNSGAGAKLALTKSGTGTLTLSGTNSLLRRHDHQWHRHNRPVHHREYFHDGVHESVRHTDCNGGQFDVVADDHVLTFGNGTPTLAFNLNSQRNFITPVIAVSGNLNLNGNVTVNVTNPVQSGTNILLQYSGSRAGSGSFVAGSLPSGLTILDDVANKRVISIYNSADRAACDHPDLRTRMKLSWRLLRHKNSEPSAMASRTIPAHFRRQ